MAYSEDHIALAAEYALGTLDAAERTQVEMMMAVDTEFTAVVHAWEYRLGVLNQMVGSVEPRPIVWENIKAAVGHSGEQAPLVLPDTASPPVESVAVAPAPAVTDHSSVIQLSDRLKRMRTLASVATALAAALIAMLAAQVYAPDLLPDGLRAKPRIQTVEVKTPAPPVVPSAQYVALLQRDGGSPAFILTIDAATRNFTVRKVSGDTAEVGKSFELWLISDRLPQPRSLGIIGGGDFTARAVLSSYDANTITAATYAVTVEQAGGSSDGKPHSAPIYTGKLIETVPGAR
jgi:anti-sigma-K factor RskA